jgi:peptide-methionine (S)-S-oxide reductase
MTMARAILGGGCFWCVEGAFKQLKGVSSALPAYAGGPKPNPTYKGVCSGKTGHAEIVEIIFEPSIIDYNTILEIFFTVHDPTQLNRQGGDIGTQYRSCIMPVEEGQEEIALEVINTMQQLYNERIVTTIEPAINFLIAEEYHHDYYARNPNQGYCTAVVSPKLSKVRSKYSHLYKE